MGNAAFGSALGTTDDEAEATLQTMYEVVGLLMRRDDEAATG